MEVATEAETLPTEQAFEKVASADVFDAEKEAIVSGMCTKNNIASHRQNTKRSRPQGAKDSKAAKKKKIDKNDENNANNKALGI